MIARIASRIHSMRKSIDGPGAGSLRARVLQSGGVILLADLYSNLLRLASNLLLTRLLFPEAFGLMLILNLVFTALDMLSDLGIRGAVIVKSGVIEQRYINTAWTMGIIRGLVLGIIALSLGYPLSQFYGEPELVTLFAIASAAPVIRALASPYPMLREKEVRFGQIAIWNTMTQTMSVVVLLAWVAMSPSVVALAANGVISATISVVLSYRIFKAPRVRLAWHVSSAWEIFGIGRWIIIASGLTFLARQADSMIMSKWVTTEMLGVFSIALGFAKLVEMLVERMSWSLLFPVFAEIRASKEGGLTKRLRTVKLALYALCAPIVVFFAAFGEDFIRFFYDERYHGAGWMLQIMAAGSAFFAAGAAILNIPMSFGDSYRHMWLQFYRFVIVVGAMVLGGYMAGVFGLIVGIAASQALFYPVLAVIASRYGVRDLVPDAIFLSVVIALVSLAWFLHGLSIPGL